MRHRYFHLDPALIEQLLANLDLMRLFNELLLASGGDVEQTMAWMQELQKRGLISENVDLQAFFDELERQRLVSPDGEGGFSLTTTGERRILLEGAGRGGKVRPGAPGWFP